jgi:hypothetical protein
MTCSTLHDSSSGFRNPDVSEIMFGSIGYFDERMPSAGQGGYNPIKRFMAHEDLLLETLHCYEEPWAWE